MTAHATTAGARLAVLLPYAYLGGTIRLLLNLVRHLAARWPGPLVLAVPADHLEVIAGDLAALRRDLPDLEIRGLRWRQKHFPSLGDFENDEELKLWRPQGGSRSHPTSATPPAIVHLSNE